MRTAKYRSIVQSILEENILARDNDIIVIKETLIRLGYPTNIEDLVYVKKNIFETISRARRKVQELNPMLKASPEVQEVRKQKEEEYREEYGHNL